jgi:hypothetical protein
MLGFRSIPGGIKEKKNGRKECRIYERENFIMVDEISESDICIVSSGKILLETFLHSLELNFVFIGL